MGIEDLRIDSQEHADRILILGDCRESAAEMGKLFDRRGYVWNVAASVSEAAGRAAEQLIDMVVIDMQQMQGSVDDLIAAIQKEPTLITASILLLHPQGESFSSGIGWHSGAQVQVIPTPIEPSALLVKVASQLRLRKLKSDQLKFENRLVQENAELRDLTNRFKQELREAKLIQETLLPKTLPSAVKTIFSACCLPMEAVGGDLFDIWKVDQRYGLFIADVTGHGLPAAFIGAMAKMALSYALKNDPSAMFLDINRGLCQHIAEGRFVTAACAFYDPDTGTMMVSRAGHPPPYLWRAAEQRLEKISPRGLPLGILLDEDYELYQTVLDAGDKLLMITDGLTETVDMDGKVLGVDGVGAYFAEAAKDRPIAKCLEHVLNQQQQFSGGRMLRDDVTMVGLERT